VINILKCSVSVGEEIQMVKTHVYPIMWSGLGDIGNFEFLLKNDFLQWAGK